MGYLYLALALFAGVAKGFYGKTISNDVESFKECLFVNMIRMLLCAVVGLIPVAVQSGLDMLCLEANVLPIYLLAGASMATFCVAWMFAYRNEAYMFLSIFTMLGTVITCVLDAVIYHAQISFLRWLGIAVVLLAVYIMSVYNKGIKGRITPKGVVILVCGTLGSALSDFSQKIYVRQIGQNAGVFNFYMYLFGFVMILVLFAVSFLNEKMPKLSAKLYSVKHMGIYFAISFFLYINSVMKTMAAGLLSAAQIYPVLQGANLIMSALMAHFLFKEKMNFKGVIGVLIAFGGLTLLNMAR